MMLSAIRAIARLILPEFRGRLLGFMALAGIVALLETLGVASVMPLVAIVIDPSIIARSRIFASLASAWGGLPPAHILGFVTIGIFAVANAASLLTAWLSIRYTAQIAVRLSELLALAHFRRPFEFFMAVPAAELAHQTCKEVANVASGGILQLCNLLSRLATVFLVVALLLAISPVFTVVLLAVSGALYSVVHRFTLRHIDAAGKRAFAASGKAAADATEMYAMARSLLLRGDCRYFLSRISTALRDCYRADAVARVLPTLPKYAIEIVAICAILALPIYRSLMGEDARPELPVLATFAYAGFRLLPMVQQLYASLTILKFYEPMANELHAAFRAAADAPEALRLDRMPGSLELAGIAYRYPARASNALSDVALTLARGSRVAVVGPSGAGKSTLVDLILGLLTPSQGTIAIDGAAVRLARFGWRPGLIGYAPQSPFIFDGTIAENIAFGVPAGGIDRARCLEAAAAADFMSVIDSHPKGLDAVIGKDLLQFSGGERQRLSIARALYGRPELIALDEPANGLDPPTARRIFELLCAPRLKATVLAITHDLDHLALFDKVVFMEGGAVTMAAPYEALVRDSEAFCRFRGAVHDQKLQA